MEVKLVKSSRVSTQYIRLNTTVCQSCWKCIDSCPNNVIGKVKFLWHSHAIIKQADKCIGCLKCVKECKFNAISKKN